MDAASKTLCLRHEKKAVEINVTVGEPFLFLSTDVHHHFPSLPDYDLFLDNVRIPKNTKVAECHINKEFSLQRKGALLVISPIRQIFPYLPGEEDKTIQSVLNAVASTLSITTGDLQITQGGIRKNNEERLSDLSADPLKAEITPYYPTLYVIENGKVILQIYSLERVTFESFMQLIRQKTSIAHSDLVVIQHGKTITEVPKINVPGDFLFLAKKLPAVITILIQMEEKPEAAIDLNESWSLVEATSNIAKKLGKESEDLLLIWNGQILRGATVKECRLSHGCKVRVILKSNKKQVFVRTPTGIYTIDVAENETIGSAKRAISRATKTSQVQQMLKVNGEQLSDDRSIPAVCFLHIACLDLTVVPCVFVRSLSGKIKKVAIETEMTIGDLRVKLKAEGFVDLKNQKISFQSRQLNNEDKLGDFGMQNKSIIDVDSL